MFSVDDSNFAFFTNPKPLVLVVFWGQNCPNCKLLEPAIVELAEKYKDDLWVVAAERGAVPQSGHALDIKYLPTCVMFKNGREIDRITGNQRYQVMEDFITGALNDYLQRAS